MSDCSLIGKPKNKITKTKIIQEKLMQFVPDQRRILVYKNGGDLLSPPSVFIFGRYH